MALENSNRTRLRPRPSSLWLLAIEASVYLAFLAYFVWVAIHAQA
jgi:hypothetical protein